MQCLCQNLKASTRWKRSERRVRNCHKALTDNSVGAFLFFIKYYIIIRATFFLKNGKKER